MSYLQKFDLYRKEKMKDMIRSIPDFPKSGIVFRDIFPLLQNCFGEVIDDLSRKIERPHEIDSIVGIESRGFIFASALAYKLNKGFIPIRKKGKLPPPTISEKVSMEYGETELEICRIEAGKCYSVLIVDDIVATGETLKTARSMCLHAGYIPLEAIALINLKDIKKEIDFQIKYLFEFKNEK